MCVCVCVCVQLAAVCVCVCVCVVVAVVVACECVCVCVRGYGANGGVWVGVCGWGGVVERAGVRRVEGNDIGEKCNWVGVVIYSVGMLMFFFFF